MHDRLVIAPVHRPLEDEDYAATKKEAHLHIAAPKPSHMFALATPERHSENLRACGCGECTSATEPNNGDVRTLFRTFFFAFTSLTRVLLRSKFLSRITLIFIG